MVLNPEQKQRRLAKIQESRNRPVYKILTPCQKLQRLKNIQRMRNNPIFKENKENIDNDKTPTINSCNDIEKTPFIIQMEMV